MQIFWSRVGSWFNSRLALDPRRVGTLFSAAWFFIDPTAPDRAKWRNVRFYIGDRGQMHSLIYNAGIFIRVGYPFLLVLYLRWSGSTTRRAFVAAIFGWKLNGNFAMTLRVQSDASSAAGYEFPNVGQSTGWNYGPH